MAKEDFYKILGIERDADAAAIKKAYRAKAMKYHPDRNPGDAAAELATDLTAATDRAPMTARVTGLRLLGRGVAFTLDCPELTALRRGVAERWRPRLTRQDAGKADLHVTVQNKVTPAAARALHDDLAAGFTPWDAGVPGLALWRYDGGPWEPGPRFPFSG